MLRIQKMIFLRNQECVLISAKVQTHPASNKKQQELAQNLKYTIEDLRIKKELICISRVVYYL
jgi:hypothetical protein